MINLKINNKNVKVNDGVTILQAAVAAGVDIPTLCSHPNLSPYGGCRLCIVAVEGNRGYPASCTTPATEGMVVTTHTSEVIKLRKNILELLLSEHTSPCIVCLHKQECQEFRPEPWKSGKVTRCQTCAKGSSCQLKKLSEEYKIDDMQLPIEYKNIELEKQDPFIDRDYNLCILCGKCVRICKELHGQAPIDFINRGQGSRVGTAFGRKHTQTECCFCGACIDICPTGAFSDKLSKWHGDADEIKKTTCKLCPAKCTVDLNIKDKKVISASSSTLTREERLCAMGRFILPEISQAPDSIDAAVKKLSEFAKEGLVKTIIADIKKKAGKSAEKAEIIPALKASIEKDKRKSIKTETVKTSKGRFEIIFKKEIVPGTHMFTINAPDIARKCQPGQFVIAMAKENSERIPYTIADWDTDIGSVTINVLEIGSSTQEMILLNAGDCLAHFVGPLGMPIEVKKYGTVVCGGGCFGVGGILPLSRALKEAGNKVISMEEASSAYLLYWQDKLAAVSDKLMILTKDGSVGIKGGVQEGIKTLKQNNEKIDQVFIIGCTFMMMSVSKLTKELDIPTTVALNPIMIDGTGMCGACRVSVDGKTKFACVDGPNFDGHKVDWELLRTRRKAYQKEEIHSSHKNKCWDK